MTIMLVLNRMVGLRWSNQLSCSHSIRNI